MPDKQPITIRRGSFVCTIFDVENLMALPLTNIRKLWRIMFSADYENENTLQTIRDWLPSTVESAKTAARDEQTRLEQVTQYVSALRSKVAAFGSMATKEQKSELKEASTVLRYAEKLAKDSKARHERAKKLQTLFNDLSKN